MNIRRLALRSVTTLAVASAVAGFYGCVQQQPAAEPVASAQPAAAPVASAQPVAPPVETVRAEPVAAPPAAVRPIKAPPKPALPASNPVAVATPVAPAPLAHHLTVPKGAEVHMTLDAPVGSATSQVGDAVTGTTTMAVLVGDEVAIPSGSTIHGQVTSVEAATKGLKVGEKGGTVVLAFTKVTTPNGTSSPLSASITSEAKSGGKTAGIIGGSAAGGAILGKILGGHTKDAAIGAVVGTGIGTGIAAGTKGKEVVLPAGTELLIALDQPLTIAGRS